MQTVLTINELDFLPFLVEDGIQYSQANRIERSVVVMDGTLYKTTKKAFSLSVTCLAVNDEALGLMLGALSVSPASVDFVNRETRVVHNGLFYVDDISFTEHSTSETETVITEMSFTLTLFKDRGAKTNGYTNTQTGDVLYLEGAYTATQVGDVLSIT